MKNAIMLKISRSARWQGAASVW